MVGRTGLKFQPPGRCKGTADNLFNEQYLLPEDPFKSKQPRRRAETLKSSVATQPQFYKARVKPKVLADLTEAIIGAFYIQGGRDTAMAAVKALGSWPEQLSPNTSFDDKNNAALEKHDIKEQNINHLLIPQKYPPFLARIANGYIKRPIFKEMDQDCNGLLELPLSESVSFTPETVDSLEEILGYRFKSMEILWEAATHCSVQNKKNNQRLEFLGDAVLDFAVVSLLAKGLKHANQGDLSTQRSAATCNSNLGRKALQLGLQRHLYVASDQLLTDFRDQLLTDFREVQFSRELDQAAVGINSDQIIATTVDFRLGDQADAVSVGCMKALADFLEALIGAIYMDSSESLETVERVVQHIGLLPQLAE